MKKILSLLLLCALTLPVAAQRTQRFNWEHEVDFRYIFDNREFAYSDDTVIPSGTMHTIVLAPTVGLSIETGNVQHRLMAGVELAHDMGTRNWADLAREPIFYYNAHARAKKGNFDAYAGIFARTNMEGAYGEAFFSGSYRNSDRLIEGVLLKWRAERFYAEIGLDWMGQYGPDSRERFQVFSAGRWQATNWLSLGWAGSFYHYACSQKALNVVDNHLLQPWVKVDFSHNNHWQELSMQASFYASYQRDRAKTADPMIPYGGELKLTAKRWNVTLQNTTYLGGNLMPYFNQRDSAGIVYATNLYFGTPCFNGFFDLAELAWTPQITRSVQLRLAARAYFDGQGFLGWQQIASLRVTL